MQTSAVSNFQTYPPRTFPFSRFLQLNQPTMAIKTSIFSLLTIFIILLIILSFFTPSVSANSLEHPRQLIDETYFQDLYNMDIHFPLSFPPSSPLPPTGSPLVPAFFVLGDSSVDCGNNNFLGTFARADRLPYGKDFDTHQPTGRFCNGRIPVDFLGLLTLFTHLLFFVF